MLGDVTGIEACSARGDNFLAVLMLSLGRCFRLSRQ